MLTITRRAFLGAGAGAALATAGVRPAACGEEASVGAPVPMLHVSDLFRPHNDPDDHWDLACVYALILQGRADLLGILIDHPHPGRNNAPDIHAVSQMNYLAGKQVPVMAGSPRPLSAAEAQLPESADSVRGIRALLDLLRRSPQSVVISILGSCRDVAIAGRMEPELFAAKCRAVYLNAGSGTPDPVRARRLEWNVHLDPASYVAIFQLPCPVYWMPCFEEVPESGQPFQTSRYGTFYRFRQAEILPQLPARLQNYFAHMYRRGVPRAGAGSPDDWLRALTSPVDQELIRGQAARDRNMWCTAGFLHACGLTVVADGRIVPLAEASEPVYRFEPIRVACSPDGVTRWSAAEVAPPRYIFCVRDVLNYPRALTAAMKSLLAAF